MKIESRDVVIGTAGGKEKGSVEEGANDDTLGEEGRHGGKGEAISFDVRIGKKLNRDLSEGSVRWIETKELAGGEAAKAHRKRVG